MVLAASAMISASASNKNLRRTGRRWKILKNETNKMPNAVEEYATMKLNCPACEST